MKILCESCNFYFDTNDVYILMDSKGGYCLCPICGERHNVKITIDAFGRKILE